MTIRTLALALAMGSAMAGAADAAPTYEINNGKLVAIRGIYGGLATQGGWTTTPVVYTATDNSKYQVLTDIEFIDGTCLEVFGRCTRLSSFSAVGARAADPLRDLLRDNVDVNGTIYNFATDTALINGCESALSCTITAGIVGNSGHVNALNFTTSAAGVQSTTGFLSGDTMADTRKSASLTFGRYTTYAVGIAAVPEPATWAMMLVGFGMIGASARYRRRARAVSFA